MFDSVFRHLPLPPRFLFAQVFVVARPTRPKQMRSPQVLHEVAVRSAHDLHSEYKTFDVSAEEDTKTPETFGLIPLDLSEIQ